MINSGELFVQSQGEILRISLKLQSLGVVLERQGKECEGFTELEGFGVILSELGHELRSIFDELDRYSIQRRSDHEIRD